MTSWLLSTHPPLKPVISGPVNLGDDSSFTAGALFDQIIIDKTKLQANIRRLLQTKAQTTPCPK